MHIIKEQCARLDIPRQFTIYDRNDSKKAVKDAVESLSLDPKQYEPGIILNTISREKGNAVTNKAYREKVHDYFSNIVADVWDRYEATLRKEKSLDFDDLLLKTALLLKHDKEIRDYYNSVWKYVHVDEYQDTNTVQYEIVKLLCVNNKNLAVVGDIDQNIYSWRGATIHNILNFEKDYPEAKVILLEENYRSTQTILAAANAIIEKNTLRRKKTLFTKNVAGEKIEVTISYTEVDEARSIASKASDLIREGKDPSEIAVLYRANFQSRALEEAFLREKVPYQILGTRFFDRKEIRDVLSFIRAAINRDSSNDLVRIINIPPRGIGKATILKVISGQAATLGPSLREKVASFTKLLDRIKALSEKETPATLIKYIMQETGMETAFKNGTPDDQEKLENIRELVSVASQYGSVETLLENAALATDQDELERTNRAVKLMTVHASKGLEFDYVFITGLEEDLFPHKRMNENNVTQAEEEEERRLFYVAITRARKKVFLSYAQLRTIFGTQKVNTPSQFISDIDKDLIEETRELLSILSIDF